MGTSDNAAEFGAKMIKTGEKLVEVNTAATAAAAQVYKDAVIASGRAATGGDGQLSRWGKDRTKVGYKGGVKLNARYQIKGKGGTTEAVLLAVPMGVWKVVEYGSSPHPIVPGATKKMRQGAQLMSLMTGADTAGALAGARKGSKKRRVMVWGNGNFAAYTRHPGTKGKKAWSTGIAKGTPGAVNAYKRQQVAALASIF